MFSRMMKLVNATDSLHLTPPQQKDVLDYAKSLPRRFAAARAVQAAETHLVEHALKAVQAAFPELGTPLDLGWDSADDDLRLCLRAITNEMLMDDTDSADAVVLAHVRRSLGYLGVPAAAVEELFAGLRDAAVNALKPDAFELLAPHFDRAAALAAGGVVAV
jgi:hypothetical protein